MKSRSARFNINFWLALTLGLVLSACSSTDPPKKTGNQKKGKEAALLYLYMETPLDGTQYTREVAIPRGSSTKISMEVSPLLDNGSLLEASIVDIDKFGSFAIRLQFNQHGILAIDNATTGNRGRHLGILCHFGKERWLAAPVISRRISDGFLQFVPDATRAEAEYIVLGLNNVAKKLKKSGAL